MSIKQRQEDKKLIFQCRSQNILFQSSVQTSTTKEEANMLRVKAKRPMDGPTDEHSEL